VVGEAALLTEPRRPTSSDLMFAISLASCTTVVWRCDTVDAICCTAVTTWAAPEPARPPVRWRLSLVNLALMSELHSSSVLWAPLPGKLMAVNLERIALSTDVISFAAKRSA
jgi:hypothetical protein